MCVPKTAVEFIGFNATPTTKGVLLEWQTGHEVDNLGFNIYRDERGKRNRITPQLIAGSALIAGPGSVLTAGDSYSWLDTSPNDKQDARYWLEDIDLNGQSTWHGPFLISPSVAFNLMSDAKPRQAATLRSLGTDVISVSQSGPIETRAKLSNLTRASLSAQANIAAQRAVKLSVKQAGWYRVSAQELFAAGLGRNINSRFLQMFVNGQEVPIAVIDKNGGHLDSSSAIEFYGIGLDAAYSDARVYWLIEGSQPGKRIRTTQERGLPVTGASFSYTIERKDKKLFFQGLNNGEEENFFGPAITKDPVDQSLLVQHVDQAVPALATLQVTLQGLTTAPHQASVSLNGDYVGVVSFDGQAKGMAKFSFLQSMLREGNNAVTLAAQGGGNDVSLVDSIRLTYRHTYMADNDALRLTVMAGQQVTINGFGTSAIRVVDVTDPDTAQAVSGEVRPQNGSYSITASAPGSGQRKLLAFTDSQIKSPAAITLHRPSDLRKTNQKADLAVITRRDFFDSVEPLAALRRSQGLKITVVDIEDIYDEFSFGQKTPFAVKDFLAFARTNWKQPPRFVLFVGDASFDPKNYLGLGEFDLVPTKLVATQAMETASDDWFADFDGDGLAEMAVGRLPVRTSQEAKTMIAKIIGYERSRSSKSVLLVADSNEGFDFMSANAQLKKLIPASLKVKEIDRGGADAATAKASLIDAINRGQTIVNYMGHGAIGFWRGNLLTSEDARGLTNAGQLSVFVMMTCWNGFFHDVFKDSLAESLMKAEQGGAVAVWASSGLTYPVGQAAMNQQLYRLLFGGNTSGAGLTLGEATRRAKATINEGDIRRTWILFGDPTTRLKS